MSPNLHGGQIEFYRFSRNQSLAAKLMHYTKHGTQILLNSTTYISNMFWCNKHLTKRKYAISDSTRSDTYNVRRYAAMLVYVAYRDVRASEVCTVQSTNVGRTFTAHKQATKAFHSFLSKKTET